MMVPFPQQPKSHLTTQQLDATLDSMRVVCLSDTHSLHRSVAVPDGDLLIHAGDQCNHGTPSELRSFARWFLKQPHPYKVLIAGNHDWPWIRRKRYALMWLKEAVYLQDRSLEIAGRKIWGSPWQPEFGNWAFNLPRGPSLARIWSEIPADTEILITHTPPLGYLDRGLGCEELRARLEHLPKLRLHVFGHIHSGYGIHRQGQTVFVNGSICDDDYAPINAPLVLDL